MDGQFISPRKALLPILALTLVILPQSLFAQAMGKAALDTTLGAPTLQSEITITSIPNFTNPAVTPSEAKTITPLPTNLTTPTTLPAATVAPAATAIDSLPTDPAKAVPATPAVPLRAIESKEIRPQTPAADSPAKTAAPSSPTSGIGSVFQVATALAVVLGLVFLGKALAKKYLPAAKVAGPKGVIEILARYPLSKTQSLVLVRIGSQIVTLNQGKDQSQSVLVISDPTEVAKIMGQIEGKSPNSITSGFNKLLSNARMDLEDPANDPDLENDFESRSMQPENLDTQLEEMAAAKRQLMELRQQVRSVRDSLPR
jgi:flagellar biogenesis protein FliO